MNTDNFLIGGSHQNMFSNNIHINTNQTANDQPMNVDFDFEKPKIKLYVPHDIIGECFNPQDFTGLVPIEDEISSDEEEIDEEKLEQYAKAKQKAIR